MFAIVPINLIVKEKIGRQTTRRQRVNPSECIANHKVGCGGFAIDVVNPKSDLGGRFAVKQNRHGVTKANILSPRADMKRQGRFALSGIAAVEKQDAVFDEQPRKLFFQRFSLNKIHVKKSIGHIFRIHQLSLRTWLLTRAFALLVHGQRVGAFHLQRRVDSGFVVDLHQKGTPTLLNQFFGSRSLRHFDSAFGINIDDGHAQGVKRFLNDPQGFTIISSSAGRGDLCQDLGRQRSTGEVHGFNQPPRGRNKRLPLQPGDDRSVLRFRNCRHGQNQQAQQSLNAANEVLRT